MIRRLSILFVLAFAGFVLVAIAEGCGSASSAPVLTDGGDDGSAAARCDVLGAACTNGSDCCSNDCDANHTCTGGLGQCGAAGASCTQATDCCSVTCSGGKCGALVCISDNQACTASADCCGGNCASGKCTPLNGTCKTAGNQCATNGDCCSGLCSNGRCSLNSSYCVQPGDVCSAAAQCCSGICNITSGQTLGVCRAPPSGPANCGLVDGMLCTGVGADGGVSLSDAGVPACGGACCSRLCAPYGATGVLICQQASGCHLVGDICQKDGDCCGSSGLPGGSGKPVTCVITAPNTVGVCRNPMGCKPDGDVCKLKTMSCNASCDCCSGNCETDDTCKQDNVGVPRCAPATCVGPGQACASSASCCNGLPCVPGPNGQLQCGAGCSPSSGTCTNDADCCNGLHCTVPLGATQGSCAPLPPPPPQPDGGTPDAGCSLYGQGCTTNADCCFSEPCTLNSQPCNGQAGCTCLQPVK